MRWCPATRRTSLSSATPLQVELEARKLWRAYSNEIERAQQTWRPLCRAFGRGGKKRRDGGPAGRGPDAVRQAGRYGGHREGDAQRNRLARWYLNEALRITEAGMLRPEIVDAIELLQVAHEQPAAPDEESASAKRALPNARQGQPRTTPTHSCRAQPYRDAEERSNPCPRRVANVAGISRAFIRDARKILRLATTTPLHAPIRFTLKHSVAFFPAYQD